MLQTSLQTALATLTLSLSFLASSLTATVSYTATPVFADAPKVIAPDTRSIPQQIDDATWRSLMPQADRETFKLIAYCESHYTQFDSKGLPLPGIAHPADKGIFQLNSDVHDLPFATIASNIASAISLYAKSGFTPWRSSRSCWQSLSTTTLPYVGVE